MSNVVVIEGVAFRVERVAGMSKADFVKIHKDVLWQDKTDDARKKLLEKVYARCAPKESKAEE